MMNKLKFGNGNAKLDKRVVTFSLPAGVTCPGADECKSMAVEKPDGKRVIMDGPKTKFRCFAASQEVQYPSTFNARRHNLDLLKGFGKGAIATLGMARLINDSLPKKTKYCRPHVSGDFFSQEYFNAWMNVAKSNTNVLFYAYTKSLHFWVNQLGNIPNNFVLTASVGGKYDKLIQQHNLRFARVVYSEEEAENLGLPIDHDDTHAMNPVGDFALLLHGTQPKGSEAGKAWSKLRKAGKSGYSARTVTGVTLPVRP